MASVDAGAPPKHRASVRGGRRRSRELAVRGIYQWLLNETPALVLLDQLREEKEHAKANDAFLCTLIHGVTANADGLREKLRPYLDREVQQLSPVEHAILLLGAYELTDCMDVPYKVVINEAVELAKIYGGTDGHKYINGVLDRLAPELRPNESRTR